MQRVLVVTALMLLGGAACATVEKAPVDARLVEAQQAFDEAVRLGEAGQYARAEPLYERALAIREEAQGKDHLKVAAALYNLASVYHAQGQYARAEPLYERALAIREEALGKAHPDVAISLYKLAGIYIEQGQYARAEPLYERALAIWDAALGKAHPNVTVLLNNLAQHHLAQQHLRAALPYFQRAFASSEQHLRQEVFGLSEARLANFLSLQRSSEELLYELVRVYPDNDQVRQLALSATLLRKGRSDEEIADTSRIIYRGLSPADRESFERLRTLRTQLSALSFAGPGQLSLVDYQERLEELTEQGDALEEELARRSERLRALHALPPASEIVERVAAALPKDGALVEFVASSNADGEVRYLSLLLFADGHTQALDLGPAAPINQAAQRLQGALASRAVSYQPAAQALYTLVFHPLVPHLGRVKRLFLSPEGQLSLVPFAALHDGRRFLVDAWDITYLTSGKDLLRAAEDKASASSVVVLADPDFSASRSAPAPSASTERSASLERFYSGPCPALTEPIRLPGTRQEAEALQRLLPQARLLLGPEATKEALLTVGAPGVLHIATHGFFLEDAPGSEDTREVEREVKPGLSGESPASCPSDPLLRSGLALAGAGVSQEVGGARGREQSLVTALELTGLDLWGTQLVVLSACDTGRGDVKLGQGVYGLRRALVVAGAETVVTSLWKVNDGTTRELMEGYYRHLLAGEGRVTALRQAMKEMRKKKPHPYYWAPFIAIGQDAPLRGLTPVAGSRLAP